MKTRWIAALLLVMTAATVSAQQSWWGLWNSSQGLTARSPLYDGSHDLYVRLTAQNSPLLVGGRIHGVRFYLSDKTAVRSCRVWLSSAYGSAPLAECQVPLADLRDLSHDGQTTEVSFADAVDVLPAQNRYASVYVGFTLQLDAQPACHLMGSAGKGVANSCFYNGQDISATYGALALQVLATGPAIAERAVTAQAVGEQVALGGGEATLPLTATSQGAEPVESVGYVVTIDGESQPERSYTLPQAADEMGCPFSVPVSYSVPAAAVPHALSVALTRVNGTPLSAAATAPAATLIALSRPTTKRTVMEEFTGSWCHNCVRGIAGINLIAQQQGDRFIAIAVHSQDQMEVAAYRGSTFYSDCMKVLGGLPSCSIDRWIDCDPYCGRNTTGAFLTDDLVAEALQRTAVADLTVSTSWTDAAESSLRCDVATDFAYSVADGHYALMLVLTADGLTGTGTDWQQRNGYNDYTGTEEALMAYAGKGIYLTDITFDHVAVDVAGVDGGLAGSISAPIVADQPQHYIHTFDVGSNTLVQDRQRLSVVALLIDTRDGSVVNAAKTAVGSAVGIAPVASAAAASQQPAAYDLQGRRVAKPSRPGVYIVGGKKQRLKDL